MGEPARRTSSGRLPAADSVGRSLEGDLIMHIKRKASQYRRDFTAIYQCEHCHPEVTGTGSDDINFHQRVIPAMACPASATTADGSTPETVTDVAEDVIL